MSNSYSNILKYIEKKEKAKANIENIIKEKREEFEKSLFFDKSKLAGIKRLISSANDKSITVRLGDLIDELRVAYNSPDLNAEVETNIASKGLNSIEFMRIAYKELPKVYVNIYGYDKELAKEEQVGPLTVSLGSFDRVQADGKTLGEHCQAKHFGFSPDVNDSTTIVVNNIEDLVVDIPFKEIYGKGKLPEAIVACEELLELTF